MSWSTDSDLAVRRDGRGGGELLRLVVDVDGDLAELVTVLARVVRAEEELAPTGQLDAEVGLRAATVAAVKGRERGARGNCSGH
jgi:hypothetical protein